METATFVEIINQTGFPIAACIGLFWLVNRTLKSQQEILQELKSAIINNTAVITQLANQVDRGNK